MTQFRTQLLLIALISLFTLAITGYACFTSSQHLETVNADLIRSFSISSIVAQSSPGKYSNEDKQTLRELIQVIEPEFRRIALSKLVHESTAKTKDDVLKIESSYRDQVEPEVEYRQQQMKYYASLFMIAAAVTVLIMIVFIFKTVFSQLHNLSEKMIDFLNYKYTYQFTIPESNEIGLLHANFNALAQRVLLQIEELKALDKAKSEFLSIASHELRTPLTSIKGSLSLLQSGLVGQFNEPTLNLMKIALSETDRLIRLINELLDLAKIEARQFPLKTDWIGARDLMKLTLESLDGLAKAANVKLISDLPVETDIYIDRDRIQQVLTNLISNAVKFSPPQTTVTIRGAVDAENHFRFEVKDQGPGIAPQDQQIIFEKFRQATSPENPLVKGTGLGLAIAKALVEQHGGVIGVTSQPKNGSTFYFTVPQWRLGQDTRKLRVA